MKWSSITNAGDMGSFLFIQHSSYVYRLNFGVEVSGLQGNLTIGLLKNIVVLLVLASPFLDSWV